MPRTRRERSPEILLKEAVSSLFVRVLILLVVAALFAPGVIFALGIATYVSVSFLVARRWLPARSSAHLLRDVWAEVWASLVTQPLMPLYYLFGRTMAGGAGHPVIVVHGYSQNRVDFWAMARALRARGMGPVYGFNYSWLARIDVSAARLGTFVDEVRAETGHETVDLVCHSMGGLVALELARERQGEGVRRCVTIATPHAGATWGGPILGACAGQLRMGSAFLTQLALARFAFPLLSIYSSHDNVVHPPSTSSMAERGGRDLVLDGGAHLSVLFDRRVHDAVAEFLGD